MTVTYDTTLRANGNNTGIEVPGEVLTELGGGGRPRLAVDVNGYRFGATVGRMGGAAMIAFSKAHRDASGLTADQPITVTLALDTAPVEVPVPTELRHALAEAGLTEAFDRLAPSRRKEHARQVADAKADATRDRRIAKVLADLG